MIDRNKYESLADALASVDDLEAVKRALIKETAIREVVRESGETREVVTQMIDATESMGQEAVLALTDGEPTTLRDALERYLDRLERALEGDPGSTLGDVAGELGALLAYPWTEEETTISTHGENASVRLAVDFPDDDHLTVSVGGQVVYSGSYDELGRAGMEGLEECARAVHRALLARVIGDREHLVQINSAETTNLIQWLARVPRSGAACVSERLTLNAVEGGGVLVRTRPYHHVTPPRAR